MGRRPELRIALAMRGGVSLAVWMGGACSEVDALRRATPDSSEAASVYSKILDAAGYAGVKVDVIAGASAGGLNGALMGSSVVFGMPFDWKIRDLWLRLADIGTLARRAVEKRPPSVLDGDSNFFAPLRRHLLETCDDAPAASDRVDLSLTGTLFDARPTFRYQQLGPALSESRNRARFRFRHMLTGSPQDSDFDPPAGRAQALTRLAYAARATSSFPGAFEPASIGFNESADEKADAIPASHYGVYSESRREGSGAHPRDYVIDGGVLDNIPVAWAIRSIAAAPANVDVDRWLVYLQPTPFPELRPRSTGRPGMRSTVKRAKELRSGTERLADDIDELQRLHAGTLLRDGFRQVVEYALGQAREGESDEEFLNHLYERALAGTAVYRERQGAVEVGRLNQLWSEPLAVMGVDPIGYRDIDFATAERRDMAALVGSLARVDGGDLVLPLEPIDTSSAAEDAPVGNRRDRLRSVGRQIRTPQALARTAAALLEAARACEDRGLASKARLYTLRAELELLIARHDRLLAQQPLVDDFEPVELTRRALWRLVQPKHQPPPPSEGWPEDAFADLWEALVREAMLLAEVAQDFPERALLSCLVKASANQVDAPGHTKAVLVALEILTGPLRPDPFTESAHVRFHMLSALNKSPLPELQPPAHRESAEDKLAGNQLANFGAFLSARWRLNDWTWGRLDAAASLIQIVTERALADDAPNSRRAAVAAVAGVPPDAPATELVDALVGRLHQAILDKELPLFSVLRDSPPSQEEKWPTSGSAPVDANVLHAIGDEKVRDILRREPARLRVAVRLGTTAIRAWLRF